MKRRALGNAVMNCRFHEMWGIAWLAKRLLVFFFKLALPQGIDCAFGRPLRWTVGQS